MAQGKKKSKKKDDVPEHVPWCIEIEFFDDRASEMYACRWVLLDSTEVKFELETGGVVTYDFQVVKKVLSMHAMPVDSTTTEQGA